MEVKINIEANQIGDTVIDLFKNLSAEKKEELALSVIKEWLQSPAFFETRNREQIIIEEFRQGKIEPWYSSTKYDADTDEQTIRNDSNFKKAMETYKTSKQIMVEDLKNEIVEYYKNYIAKEVKENELIEKIKNETFDMVANEFPNIIMQVMVQVFADNLMQMRNYIFETANKAVRFEWMANDILNRMRG